MHRRYITIFTVLFAGLFLAIPAGAHTPLLSVEDNEDGTISIVGAFSDGSSGAGITILIVEDKVYEGDKEGKDLYQGNLVLLRTKLDEFGELDLDKPDVPYFIVFDAGPGHLVEQDGPPLTEEEKKSE